MKKIHCFFVLAIFFVFALFFLGNRDGPERVTSICGGPVLFVKNSGDCIQCHGGLDADKIVTGSSPLMDTETAFAYVVSHYDDGIRFDPG